MRVAAQAMERLLLPRGRRGIPDRPAARVVRLQAQRRLVAVRREGMPPPLGLRAEGNPGLVRLAERLQARRVDGEGDLAIAHRERGARIGRTEHGIVAADEAAPVDGHGAPMVRARAAARQDAVARRIGTGYSTRMAKITLIGAGSTGFAKPFLVDIMSRPGLADATVSLMDIDAKKLAVTESLARKIARQLKAPNRIEATTDRRRALDGADYVVSVVLLHGIEPYEHALNTTLRHGVNASIGCTTGPSGVFMFLRYVPYQRAITKDMMEVCPDCLYLHYSNPTTMVPWYVNLVAPRIRSIGMCHSVQHSASQIADYIGAPLDETRHWVAGVNHQAWFLRYEWNGKDAYPLLREAAKRPEVYEADIVRFEMLKFFGYFLTESSVHNSEYVPYFRRTKADIERYTDRRGGWAGAGLERTNAQIWRASIEKGRGRARGGGDRRRSRGHQGEHGVHGGDLRRHRDEHALPVQRQRPQHRPDHQPAARAAASRCRASSTAPGCTRASSESCRPSARRSTGAASRATSAR